MIHPIGAASIAFVLVGSCLSCRESADTSAPTEATAAQATSNEKQPQDVPRVVPIPLGEFAGGTRPGQFTRDPALEPVSFSIKVGPFEIDRRPYPNLPGKPPLLGASLDEAGRLCGEAGARLCTEVEWERACRGPDGHAYASGETWNPECSDGCPSGFGVEQLGHLPELTSSVFGARSPVAGRPVLRGPAADEPKEVEHRCAHRSALGKLPPNVAFRCCRGAPNAARVPEPVDGPVFEKRALPPDELRKLLSAHPKTSDLTEELVLFGEPEAINTVIARGPGNKMGFDFTTTPLIWRPTHGAEFLVLAAKNGKETSFVLAYHVVGEAEYELASSFVMRGETGPVVLAYSPSIRPRLHFSSCWGCPGETGKVLFREPDRAVILQP